LRSGFFFSRGTSPAGTRAETDWADVCMSKCKPQQHSALHLRTPFSTARPPKSHWVRALNRDPPWPALLARSLSSDLPLLPKYIRTSCPRFSPRNRLLSRSPASETTRNILQFLLPKPFRLEPAACTCAYLTQARPLDYLPIHLHGTASTAVLNNNTTTLKLHSFLHPHNACPATFSPSSLPGPPSQPTSSSSA